MANLQVKDMDDRLYEALREKAKPENRSISQEVITIINIDEEIRKSIELKREFAECRSLDAIPVASRKAGSPDSFPLLFHEVSFVSAELFNEIIKRNIS